MPLQPVPERPGLWRDALWKPNQPGVYALVVGVGAYPHLAGGDGERAADDFGLEQLEASARTAARVFHWLRHGYRRDTLPVVWCQLLLSPTPAVKAELDAEGLRHYVAPTHANFVAAIQQWTGMLPVDPVAARASRSLFFYSGHGVQSNWHALLLPSDYLDPSQGLTPQFQHCISTRELKRWMDENPVGEHLALVDACRNEFSPLASRGAAALTGFPVAAPGPAPRTAALLAATSPSMVAYQVPGRRFTVFGQALVEAVEGAAEPGGGELDFRELVDFVRPRVNFILREAGSTLTQEVRPQVDGDDRMVVTEVPAAPVAGAAARPTRGRPVTAAAPPRVPTTRGAAGQAATRAMADRARASLVANTDPIPLEALRRSFHEAHRRMGHETTSIIWHGDDAARLYSLADGRRLEGGATVTGVARDERSQVVHVDLRLDRAPGGVLLVFEGAGHVHRERLAVALPTDPGHAVPVRLALHVAPSQPGGRPLLQGLTGRLGPDPGHAHYSYLWELSQHAKLNSLAEAADQADPLRLQQALGRVARHPTAAVAGALLLVRGGRTEAIHGWTDALAADGPQLPDATVLAAATQADEPAAMAAVMERLLAQGVPFFADCVDLADDLVRQALRAGLPPARAAAMRRLQHGLGRLFELATPGGDFIVLSGLPRPGWMPGAPDRALQVREMLRALRGPGL